MDTSHKIVIKQTEKREKKMIWVEKQRKGSRKGFLRKGFSAERAPWVNRMARVMERRPRRRWQLPPLPRPQKIGRLYSLKPNLHTARKAGRKVPSLWFSWVLPVFCHSRSIWGEKKTLKTMQAEGDVETKVLTPTMYLRGWKREALCYCPKLSCFCFLNLFRKGGALELWKLWGGAPSS